MAGPRRSAPRRSRLLLARGDARGGAASIATALAVIDDPLTRARLLPAGVEIALAAGDRTTAADAAEDFLGIAEHFDTDALVGAAAHATAAVRLDSGDAVGAVKELRAAGRAWRLAGMPYDAARSQLALGRALWAMGDRDGAEVQVAAAARTFHSLGAIPDADAAATELASSG